MEKITAAAGANATEVKTLIQFLFARSKRGEASSISAKEILDSCPNIQTSGKQNLRVQLTRVRQQLASFYEKHPDEEIHVELANHDHNLVFTLNQKPSPIVDRFWQTYFASFYSTKLYYIEPQFFRHRNGIYLRHAKANSRDTKSVYLDLTNIKSADLIPSYSFVPSGFAISMSQLFRCFHRCGSAIEAVALKPTEEELPIDFRNAIVLATPTTSLELVSSYQHDCPMQTTRENNRNIFRVRGREPVVDEVQEEEDFENDYADLVKWALLTRRVVRVLVPSEKKPVERTVTIICGHSRSVQAVAHLLTSEEELKLLRKKLGGRFPKEFQSLFEVKMHKRFGELTECTARPTVAMPISVRTSLTATVE